MITALSFLLLPIFGGSAQVALTLPVLLTNASSTFAHNQEPQGATQNPVAPKPEKKKFARLSSPNKKIVQAGLRNLEKGKEQEDIDAGITQLLQVGEAAIPMCLHAALRMEKAKRLAPLLATLDQLLSDDDLPLAWSSLRKKSPDSIRKYILRRFADSKRKDADEFLTPFLKSDSAALAYEAARGLVLRGDQDALSIIEEQVRSRWLKEAATFRSDFAAVQRRALSSSLEPWLKRPRLKEKLAGLRMFELFGIQEQVHLIVPFLSESDTSLRLAAINACRVVIAKEEPLNRPSMTEIIERAEAWKAKL